MLIKNAFASIAFTLVLTQPAVSETSQLFLLEEVQVLDSAPNEEPPLPASDLVPGNYRSTAGFFYDNSFKISNWGNKKYISGNFRYGGFPVPFDGLLVRDASSPETLTYSGEGQLHAQYARGSVTCNYGVSFTIEVFEGAFYVKHYSPDAIPESIHNGYCPPPRPYNWYIHSHPYSLNP